MAKGNFRVFLIYELGAGPAPGTEQRFSLADFLRYYSVIFIRVKLLTRDLYTYVISLYSTARIESTALITTENEWKRLEGHKRIGCIQLIRQTFQQLLVLSLFVCIKYCRYSLLFALFEVVLSNRK